MVFYNIMLYVDMDFYHFGKNEIKENSIRINVQLCHRYNKLNRIEAPSFVAFLT